MEEYDFLDEMCFIALDISKEVKFAAVIDPNGKLIAGKQCKNNYYINNSLAKTRLLQSSSAAQENRQDNLNVSTTFCYYNTNYLFYVNYLTTILRRIKNDMQRSDNNAVQRSAHRIELVQIHGLLKLVITPLTARNDKYLCIYLESRSSNQEIIAKIRNAI
ncbi:MAG: hypothetical protein WBQ25_14915 [Nitrososphaeraceae archaeon]